RFHNPDDVQEAYVAIELFDPSGQRVASQQQQVATGSGSSAIDGLTVKRPILWSPADPLLYTIRLTLTAGNDTAIHTERIGFRHFEFAEKGPFCLNGERLLLRGTHRHEDHAGVGPAMTEDMIWHEMRLMKEMGVNFIRLGHYQQSRIVL